MAAKTVVKIFTYLTFCEFLSFTLLLLHLPAKIKGAIGLSLLEVQVVSRDRSGLAGKPAYISRHLCTIVHGSRH